MMQITLFVDSEEKVFSVPFIKGRMFRRVIEINKKYNLNDIEPETLDVLAGFVVECFDGQFTLEQFYDGVPADELIDTVLEYVNKVAGVGKGTENPNLKKKSK